MYLCLMNAVYILLGANLNNPLQQLARARTLLGQRLGKEVCASSIYESEAWGIEDQPIFFNQVLLLESLYNAAHTLGICLQVENELGRIRTKKWGARVIDIDMLYFNKDVVNKEDLIIPHPFIAQRRFTLEPLVEIAADFIHPLLNKSNAQLLRETTDSLQVRKII